MVSSFEILNAAEDSGTGESVSGGARLATGTVGVTEREVDDGCSPFSTED